MRLSELLDELVELINNNGDIDVFIAVEKSNELVFDYELKNINICKVENHASDGKYGVVIYPNNYE